jgi:hypothetical protein
VTFSNGGPQSVTLKLYFDTTRNPSNVRAFTAPLWKMLMIDEDTRDTVTGKGQPPAVAFEWGGLYFKAVITSMTETFKLFDAEGIPLRCEVSVTLQQYIDESVDDSDDRRRPHGQRRQSEWTAVLELSPDLRAEQHR